MSKPFTPHAPGNGEWQALMEQEPEKFGDRKTPKPRLTPEEMELADGAEE
jgi:hypothetical protein